MKIEAQKYGGFQCCNREDRDESPAQRTGPFGSALLVAGFINGLTRGARAIAYAIPVALAAELDRWRSGLLLSALSAAAVFAFSPD